MQISKALTFRQCLTILKGRDFKATLLALLQCSRNKSTIGNLTVRNTSKTQIAVWARAALLLVYEVYVA